MGPDIKLEIQGLSVFYTKRDGSRLQALDNVSFSVREGEFLSIVGPSGCGKSTLLKIISGLAQASSGTISLKGLGSRSVSSQVAMVFQQDSLFPWRTAHANVVFGMELRKVPRKEADERASHLLKLVGLEGFGASYPHELSGGMRQRVNIARALAVDPQVLLMDEPFGALDAQTRELMQEELLRIWSESKKTVIFITHDIGEAVYLSDRVLLMGRRPGSIRAETVVDLPRPRDLSVKRTPAFHEIADRLALELEKEVRATAAAARRGHSA